MDLPGKIRSARKQARLSQQELSEAIGVSDKAISAYEVGRSAPRLKVLTKISVATNQSLSYFLSNQPEEISDHILTKLTSIEQELKQLRQLLTKK